MSARTVIAGDIGGTSTRLMLAEVDGARVKPLRRETYPSAAHDGLEAILQRFLAEVAAQDVEAACFAVAGPVEQGCARLTNLPWRVDAQAISYATGISGVAVVNDFEGAAVGVEALAPAEVEVLQAGEPVAGGRRVVLGAGTGLGVAWLAGEGAAARATPTEAGHMDFAPSGMLQINLLQHLAARLGHVSWERLVSGPGLVEIFRYVDEELGDAPLGLGRLEPGADPAARIAELALKRRHPAAEEALEIFVRLYGAFAGNLALAGLTLGGVYLAGGIAPKILPALRGGAFLEAFRAKGRFEPLLARIPVRVVLNDALGMLGAAIIAARLGR